MPIMLSIRFRKAFLFIALSYFAPMGER
jgi:hypothetical protein